MTTRSFLGFSDAPPPPPAKSRREESAEREARILELLAQRPMTMRELEAAGAGDMQRINNALYKLRKAGTVIKAGERQREQGRRYGRGADFVYGLPEARS